MSRTWLRARVVALTGPVLLIWLTCTAPAQVVEVTAVLDAASIPVGGSTTLRVRAQVIPEQRAAAERIFSWYVDVLNTNGGVAQGRYSEMVRAASDNDARSSSSGVQSGANRLGIYDTFLGLPGAGVNTPVELMAVPVTGVAPGRTEFSVRAGTAVPALSADFLVAPLDGTEPLLGGRYTAAPAGLTVYDASPVRLMIAVRSLGATTNEVRLSFAPIVGRNATVETADALGGTSWQALPGAPHNSGSLTLTNPVGRAFYRLRLD